MALSQELQSFKISPEENEEESWEKFCKLRSSLRQENAISDLFLHSIFFNTCTKAQKIKRNEEHYFREILEEETDESVHEQFRKVFKKQKIIGKRAATKVSDQKSKEKVMLCEDNDEEKMEEVRYGN